MIGNKNAMAMEANCGQRKGGEVKGVVEDRKEVRVLACSEELKNLT